MKTITGSCHDYRATATCDLEMDTEDKDRKIEMPLLLMWGARVNRPNDPPCSLRSGLTTPRISCVPRRCIAATTCRRKSPTRCTTGSFSCSARRFQRAEGFAVGRNAHLPSSSGSRTVIPGRPPVILARAYRHPQARVPSSSCARTSSSGSTRGSASTDWAGAREAWCSRQTILRSSRRMTEQRP